MPMEQSVRLLRLSYNSALQASLLNSFFPQLTKHRSVLDLSHIKRVGTGAEKIWPQGLYEIWSMFKRWVWVHKYEYQRKTWMSDIFNLYSNCRGFGSLDLAFFQIIEDGCPRQFSARTMKNMIRQGSSLCRHICVSSSSFFIFTALYLPYEMTINTIIPAQWMIFCSKPPIFRTMDSTNVGSALVCAIHYCCIRSLTAP